ncbi:MAG TPA: CcoQ/FixQ family Cbb3-type cytochrome c oxidase assembly chaperone [Alphaproteobacteria bacterium]|nr:CcoQ/FixQ family Cbb3-type cytochrome c oxidase assembly chaperone [Alphaproteobacteria bacterium]HAJ46881.1 CcoQ/FixQ family Cbb3-type cytochrome c oxidase assembly chaperone [Alphaproteobacteria bacterium]
MTTYQQWAQFAATWGLLYFFALFAGVVIYAYWPRNRAKFDDAAQIPLREDGADRAQGRAE